MDGECALDHLDLARHALCADACAGPDPVGRRSAEAARTQRRGGGRIGNSHLARGGAVRSEEHTSELQSLMRISYAVFCLKQKHKKDQQCKASKDQKTKVQTYSTVKNSIIQN